MKQFTDFTLFVKTTEVIIVQLFFLGIQIGTYLASNAKAHKLIEL